MTRQPVGIPESPWLTSEEAARYMRFPSVRAFYRFLESHDIPHGNVGRHLRWERRVLDAYMRNELWTKRRAG